MNKPTCIIVGPIFNRSGYGDLATAIAKSIIRYDKYDVKLSLTAWGQCQRKYILDTNISPDDKGLYDMILRSKPTYKPDVFIQISIPNEFVRGGEYNIGITAGIETTKASGEFMDGMNVPDLAITTSNFSKNVFDTTHIIKTYSDGKQEPIKIKTPIEVCFWGADTNIYKKTDERVLSVDEEMNKIPEDFAFLFVGQWTHDSIHGDRKDIVNLIRTFIRAFQNKSFKNPPCLILKTSGTKFSNIDRFEMFKRISIIEQEFPKENRPKIYLLHGELTDIEMNALFNHPKVKCHVSFTHGEGFGHPLLLQTLSGKPLFVSDWSGHKDFLNPQYANLLGGKLEPIPQYLVNKWLIEGSNWFNVNYNLAEEKLRNVFLNSNKEKLIKNAELLRLENMEKFNLHEMDKQLWSILDKHVVLFNKKNKFVLPTLKEV